MNSNKITRFLVLALVMAFAFAAFVPFNAQAAAPAKKGDASKDLPTIVETALAVNAKSGEFSTLIAALSAAGLVDKFNGNTHYTVFAPTDAAFAKLGLNAKNVGSLPTSDLRNILAFHVARGDRYANSVVNASKINMLNGDKAYPSVKADGAYIDNAKIVTTNIKTSNGVIHIIDSVILPPAK